MGFPNVPDGSCIVRGCTDPSALSLDPRATEHAEAFCRYDIAGCTLPQAVNYDAAATRYLDGACEWPVLGCTDSRAINYHSAANTDAVFGKYKAGTCASVGLDGNIAQAAGPY